VLEGGRGETDTGRCESGYHARRSRADERRGLKLRRLGYRVVRVSAELVLDDLPAAVALVRAAL
jgi:very-short-patch-repair endonuclease